MGRLSAMPKAKPARTPLVTEHALLRFLERVMDVDMDAVRDMILTPERIEAIEAGVRKIHVPEWGVTLVISEYGAVVTCSPIKGRRA